MANHLYSFIIKTESCHQEPILIVGLALEDDKDFQKELQVRFTRWELPKEVQREPFLLDFYLAKELTRECPSYVVALGATIKTELTHGCSGGVLGDPHAEPRSVNLYTEELSEGLVLAGLPGGPGIICRATEEEAMSLISSIEGMERGNGPLLLTHLARLAKNEEVPYWIGVADGSGYSQGAVGVMQAGEIEIITLE